VVWLDWSWLEESPAAIYEFYNCLSNILLKSKVLSRQCQQILICTKAFQSSTNPLLLLDNKILGAARRAFENQSGPILPVKKSAKFVSNGQFSFEKLAAQCLPLLTTGQCESHQL
jgi:hypothetical protein